jgi:SAM-dependent methyltransferase
VIGQATARIEQFPRRWFQTLWGHADIDLRQKWWAVWPHLAQLPHGRLDVLDAGCGAGLWVLELAALRPEWRVQGIDRDAASIAQAEEARRRLGLHNTSFACSEYFAFEADKQFDVVLVVASAHYLAKEGAACRLFETYARWLKPGGGLIFIDTRWDGTSPFFWSLPHPRTYHNVFSFDQLKAITRRAGLIVESLAGTIGPLGVAAKQLGWLTSVHSCPVREEPTRVRALHPALYPARFGLAWLDSRRTFRPDQLTLMWLLVARAPLLIAGQLESRV